MQTQTNHMVAVAVLCWTVSCAVSDQSQLHGTYVADYDVATEKLALNRDGTFAQSVTLRATSEILLAKGSWKYDAQSGYVTFGEGFLHVVDMFGRFDPNYERRAPEFARDHIPAGQTDRTSRG